MIENISYRDISIYLGYLILMVNVLFYLKSYRQKTIAFKFLSIYLISSFIIQILSEYIASYKGNNIFLFHYFNIIQFILLSLFYLNVFKSKNLKKVIIYGGIIVFLVVVYIIFSTKEYYYKFILSEILVLNIPLLIYSFIFFIRRIDSANKLFIYFNSGFFVYAVCSTLLFCAGHIESEIKYLLWNVNTTLYVFYQILIFIEWYKNFRKKTPEIPTKISKQV